MIATERKRLCPLEAAMSVIDGRWKTLILCVLSKSERPLRFGELMSSIDGVSSRMLSRQLKELEKDRLVIRSVYPEVPARVEYTLAPRAENLIPILQKLAKWGIDNALGSFADISALTQAERQ